MAGNRKITLTHLSALFAAICIAYAGILHAPFAPWDDADYVFHTEDIRNGIGWQQIRNWFTHYYVGNYQPLPVFTYALDHLIGGDNPFVYHIDSVLWHIADAWLVYFLLRKIRANTTIAFFVALLFALHPVQAESVTWIAARNKGMNAFFFFATLLAYMSYLEQKATSKFVWVCILGALAYLCKATALSLPIALFAIDIWMHRPLNNKRVWLEKLPLVLLAIPVAWATIDAQKQVDFLWRHSSGISISSIVFAGYAFVKYIILLLIPMKLTILYPYPPSVGFIHVLSMVIAICIGAGIIVAYKKKLFVLAGGLLFFTANMLPVLQFIQFGDFLMTNRYLYVACIGIFFPLVYYPYTWFQKKEKKYVPIALYSVFAGIMLFTTIRSNTIWSSETNFLNSILEDFPESPVAQYSAGALYMKLGNYREANVHFDKAIQLDPNEYKAWYNKGALALREGKVTEALEALNKCLDISPYPPAYFSRALLYMGTKKYDLALSDAEKTLAAQPANARAWYIKGYCLEQQPNMQPAIDCYSKAILLEDNEPLFYLRRGKVYAQTNQNQYALNDLNKALALDQANGEALYYRGVATYNSGQSPCADFRAALSKGYKVPADVMQKLCTQ